MGNALSAALLAEVPGMLRIGSMRVPVFGLLAALGVIAALLLSQYTARFVGIAPGLLWDAGEGAPGWFRGRLKVFFGLIRFD